MLQPREGSGGWCVDGTHLPFGLDDRVVVVVFFFQAEDGMRVLVRSRGLGDVYKRQIGSIRAVGVEDEADAADGAGSTVAVSDGDGAVGSEATGGGVSAPGTGAHGTVRSTGTACSATASATSRYAAPSSCLL